MSNKKKTPSLSEQLQYQKKLVRVIRAERDAFQKQAEKLDEQITCLDGKIGGQRQQIDDMSVTFGRRQREFTEELAKLEQQNAANTTDLERARRQLNAKDEQVRVLLDKLSAAEKTAEKISNEADEPDAMFLAATKRGTDAAIAFCTAVVANLRANNEVKLNNAAEIVFNRWMERIAALEAYKATKPEEPMLNDAEKQLVRNRQKIHAILSLRQRYGLGLVEAKGLVDGYAVSVGMPLDSAGPGISLDEEELKLLRADRKIETIKHLFTRFNRPPYTLGLKQAKDVVDFVSGLTKVDPQPFPKEKPSERVEAVPEGEAR